MKILNQANGMKLKLLCIIGLIMLFENCSKEPSCGDQSDIVNSYYISADDKSKIPFKGNDTLTYISDAGDTAILIGSGKREFIDKVRTVISGNADCYKYNVDNNETISIDYTGNNIEINNIKYTIIGRSSKTLIEYKLNSYMGNKYPNNFNNINLYVDSVNITNTFYKGIPINSINFNTLYNFNYGFLKIQFNGGKIWLLKI